MLKLVRVVLVLGYFLLVALLGIFVCLFRPFNPDNTRICGRMFSWGAIRLLGVSLQIEGREHLKNMQAGIVIANHQSNLDLFVHGAVIPQRTVSVGKKSLRYLPFFGQVYWLSGNIMIDRSKRQQSIDTMKQITEAIREKNTSIWVFPEGTRNHGRGTKPFKKGAFHMAIQAGCPIYPICASTYSGKLDLTKWRSGVVRVRILPPVSTEPFSDANMSDLLETVQRQVQEAIVELDNQISQDSDFSIQTDAA